MAETLAIVALWLGFAITHMGMSALGPRRWLVDRLGNGPFLALYSLVSLVFFVPLVGYYLGHKHAGPLLWSIPVYGPVRWLLYGGMGVALTLVAAGLAKPSPASFLAGKPEVRGVSRISRHPMFMGFGLLALLHLVPNGFASDVAFFGGLALFSVVGCRHQDRRKVVTGHPAYGEFVDATPFLPFTGPGRLQALQEIGPLVLAVGILVTVCVRLWVHPRWFGG